MVVMAKKRPTPARQPANPWPARLKALREMYDITQKEAAARVCAPVTTWRNWEYGTRQPNPMIQRLIELTFPEFFNTK